MMHRPHGNSPFTAEQVIRIREIVAGGYAPREIARFYQVGIETIRRIVRRDTWDWLPATIEEYRAQQQQVGAKLAELQQVKTEDAQASLARLLAGNPDLIGK